MTGVALYKWDNENKCSVPVEHGDIQIKGRFSVEVNIPDCKFEVKSDKFGTKIMLSAKKSAPYRIWYSEIGKDVEVKKKKCCSAKTQDKAKRFQRKRDAFTGQFKNGTKDVVEFKRNGLRHSCSTYLVSRSRNYEPIARQMWHSVAMLQEHYAKGLTYEDSEAFWNLAPYTEEEGIARKVGEEMALELKEKISVCASRI